MIAFLEGNSKIGLRQAIDQVPLPYDCQQSVFELDAKTAEIDLEKCNSHNFGSFVTVTLTLDRVEVIQVRISGRVLPTHQIRAKSEKKLCGRTYGRTRLVVSPRI